MIASWATTRGGAPAVRRRFGLVEVHAEAVVDVAVGEHRGVEPVGAPGAQRLVHLAAEERAARVDDDEAVVGARTRRRSRTRRRTRSCREISARSPNWLNGWCSAGSSAPVNSRSAVVEHVGHAAGVKHGAARRVLDPENGNLFSFWRDERRGARGRRAGAQPGGAAQAGARRDARARRQGRLRRGADARRRGRGRRRARNRLPVLLEQGAAAARGERRSGRGARRRACSTGRRRASRRRTASSTSCGARATCS